MSENRTYYSSLPILIGQLDRLKKGLIRIVGLEIDKTDFDLIEKSFGDDVNITLSTKFSNTTGVYFEVLEKANNILNGFLDYLKKIFPDIKGKILILSREDSTSGEHDIVVEFKISIPFERNQIPSEKIGET